MSACCDAGVGSLVENKPLAPSAGTPVPPLALDSVTTVRAQFPIAQLMTLLTVVQYRLTESSATLLGWSTVASTVGCRQLPSQFGNVTPASPQVGPAPSASAASAPLSPAVSPTSGHVTSAEPASD